MRYTARWVWRAGRSLRQRRAASPAPPPVRCVSPCARARASWQALDLSSTDIGIKIGPFPSWSDPDKIVALDPWGHLATQALTRTRTRARARTRTRTRTRARARARTRSRARARARARARTRSRARARRYLRRCRGGGRRRGGRGCLARQQPRRAASDPRRIATRPGGTPPLGVTPPLGGTPRPGGTPPRRRRGARRRGGRRRGGRRRAGIGRPARRGRGRPRVRVRVRGRVRVRVREC